MHSLARVAALGFFLAMSSGLYSVTAFGWQSLPVTAPIDCADSIPNVSFRITSEYDVGNAFLSTFASHIVEKQSKDVIESQLQAWQFRDVKYFGQLSKGVYAFLGEADGFRLVAFRGTTSWEEVFKDALIKQVSYSRIGFDGYGHMGMLKHYEKVAALVMPELLARIQADPKPLFLTGHSLGGAIAVLHGMHLKRLGHDVTAIYTSGQPRIGNEDFYAQLKELVGDRYYRLEHPHDITPRVPPSHDVAEEFARIIPWDLGLLQSQLEGLVRRLNYHKPEGFTMFLDKHLLPSEESGVDFDQVFWASLDGALQGARSLKQISDQINDRLLNHPAMRYLCNFSKDIRESSLAGLK